MLVCTAWPAALIIALHDNTITMAATSWAVCRCRDWCIGAISCSQTHTHTHKTRPLFSASDSIATPESLFRSLVTFTTQISSRRLGVAGLASHCLACSQSDSVWCMHAGTCATAVSPDDENEILFSALADTSRRLTAACMQRSHAPCTGWRGTRGERLSYLAQIKAAVPALVGDHQVERD